MTMTKSFLCISLAAIITLTTTACGNSAPAPAPSQSATASSEATSSSSVAVTPGSFVITGAKDGDITVDISEVTALAPINMEVAKKTSNGDSMMTITGGDFNELLTKHGLSQKDLNTVRLEAADGYSIELPKEILSTRQIILAYIADGKPLSAEEAPIWVVIPEERAMYWAKNITTISLNAATEEKASAKKIVLLETAAAALTQTDVDGEKAVSAKELLQAMGHSTLPEAFAVTAADGLEKSETSEVLGKASILVTGSDAPKITGADMPKGMQIKNVLSFSADSTAMVSVNSCMTASGKTEADGKSGVAVSAVLKSAGMEDASAYLFTAADGYEKEIAAADIASGIIYVNDEGKLTTFFNGLPKNTAVKDLLSIIAK
ncbi:MAG: molybdopterin-dependent oxidoreductase [Angelakisella sp.]